MISSENEFVFAEGISKIGQSLNVVVDLMGSRLPRLTHHLAKGFELVVDDIKDSDFP
jgi:hypothetical protein